MATVTSNEVVEHKAFVAKLTITGELDRITDPSQIRAIALVDQHQLDAEGNDIGNLGSLKRIELSFTMEELVAHTGFIDFIGEKIDEQLEEIENGESII